MPTNTQTNAKKGENRKHYLKSELKQNIADKKKSNHLKKKNTPKANKKTNMVTVQRNWLIYPLEIYNNIC